MPPLTAPATEPAIIEPAPILSEKAEGTIEYTVVKGDSLGTIAKRHNVSKAEICALNKIADPNKIRIGQKLIIPRHSGHVAPAAAPSSHADKPKEKKIHSSKAEIETHSPSLAAGVGEYVVVAGDSLSKIASKFNCKVGELREVNQLASDKLKVGQKLKLPQKKSESVSPTAETTPGADSAPAMEAAPQPSAATDSAAAATPAPAVSSEAKPAAKPLTSGITHTVLAEESLDSIAKLYGVSVDQIAEANQMGANRTIKIGQKLIIPQP